MEDIRDPVLLCDGTAGVDAVSNLNSTEVSDCVSTSGEQTFVCHDNRAELSNLNISDLSEKTKAKLSISISKPVKINSKLSELNPENSSHSNLLLNGCDSKLINGFTKEDLISRLCRDISNENGFINHQCQCDVQKVGADNFSNISENLCATCGNDKVNKKETMDVKSIGGKSKNLQQNIHESSDSTISHHGAICHTKTEKLDTEVNRIDSSIVDSLHDVNAESVKGTHQNFACDQNSQSSCKKETLCIDYIRYSSELQMPDIMRLIQKDLSEPYSIYTYRYFIHNWPELCFLATHGEKCVGAIVCKLDHHNKVKRGYIAMLAVDENYRKQKIGSNLVLRAIQAMVAGEAGEIVLETEITNKPALRLYENLGFVRDKRLFRYYLNGVDALRLKLWIR